MLGPIYAYYKLMSIASDCCKYTVYTCSSAMGSSSESVSQLLEDLISHHLHFDSPITHNELTANKRVNHKLKTLLYETLLSHRKGNFKYYICNSIHSYYLIKLNCNGSYLYLVYTYKCSPKFIDILFLFLVEI